MKALVGIGNPGPEYEGTRHNLGFLVIEALGRILRVRLDRREHGSLVGVAQAGGEQIFLLKPQTYVNLSGQAVRSLVKRGLTPGDLMVIVDDLSLPIGSIRVRPGGSDGGHKGLRSVAEALSGTGFARLRIGIGAPPPGMDAADYVLEPPPADEWKLLAAAIEESARALAVWLRRRDLRMLMSAVNKTREPAESAGTEEPSRGAVVPEEKEDDV
jgi:PTH1 family peptidyl-tRNA hydrolase